MRLFVNSRGFGRQADYQWHVIGPEGEQPVDIPSLYQSYVRGSMIYSGDQAYVLGRFGDELALLITAVPSANRRDFMSREVHDSLFFVGTHGDEAALRGIAGRALIDPMWLPDLLDGALAFDEEKRFTVDPSVLDSMLSAGDSGQADPDATPRVHRLSDVSRRELGEELRAARLPARDGFLVVVTTVQSLQKLADAGIWRALAEGVSSEGSWDDRPRRRWNLW